LRRLRLRRLRGTDLFERRYLPLQSLHTLQQLLNGLILRALIFIVRRLPGNGYPAARRDERPQQESECASQAKAHNGLFGQDP
jgi:hypothetical protein